MKLKARISNKPFAVPIEMRPLWRICLILISISVVGKDYLDNKKLNILVWMLIRKTKWVNYEDFLLNKTTIPPLVSVDTATYKAIEFSRAKKFISIKEKKVFITEEGKQLYNLLVKKDIMGEEREFLASFGKKLTENKVKNLIGGSK